MVATNYTSSGIAGLNGGYAFPPGSGMTQFMDNVNSAAALALVGSDGQNVVSWANGLVQQQQARKAAEATQGQSALGGTTGSGSELISQIFSTIAFILNNMMKKES